MRGKLGIRGEGTENDTLYIGLVTKAQPLRAYKVGEAVMLAVRGEAERIGSGWDAWGRWTTSYRVYKTDGSPLARADRYHSIAPWTEHDYATDILDMNLGGMPSYSYSGYVEMYASGSPDIMVDRRNFTVVLTTDGGDGGGISWTPILIGGGLLAALGIFVMARQRR